MSQDGDEAGFSKEHTSVSGPTTPTERQDRLKNVYGGVERETEFHVVVEQDGKLYAVPSGGTIRLPPTIETVYVPFGDAVEYQFYVVGLEADIECSNGEGRTSIQTTHQLRQKGGSEFGEPWAVEATLEERTGGLIVPTELKFEGLAKHAALGRAIERGVEGGPDILGDIV